MDIIAQYNHQVGVLEYDDFIYIRKGTLFAMDFGLNFTIHCLVTSCCILFFCSRSFLVPL